MRWYIAILAIFLLSLTPTPTTAFPHLARSTRGLLDNLIGNPAVNLALNKLVNTLIAPTTCPNSTYKVDPVNYPFIAPGPNDYRGPCPGLNAMANHGYLPRNGLASAQQLKDACICITGLDPKICSGLIVAGYLSTADLVKDQMSLGPPVDNPDGSTNLTPDVGLCQKTGIQKDASLSQADITVGGDCKPNITLWGQYQAIAAASSDPYGPISWADGNYERYECSRDSTPGFSWTVTPFLTSCIASTFANKSFPKGAPGNKPNADVEFSWFMDNRIPSYYVYDANIIVGIADVVEMTKVFIARHNDPLWIATFKPPQRPECYPCWWRWIFEDTYVGFANILLPLWNSFAPYSQCVTTLCTRGNC